MTTISHMCPVRSARRQRRARGLGRRCLYARHAVALSSSRALGRPYYPRFCEPAAHGATSTLSYAWCRRRSYSVLMTVLFLDRHCCGLRYVSSVHELSGSTSLAPRIPYLSPVDPSSQRTSSPAATCTVSRSRRPRGTEGRSIGMCSHVLGSTWKRRRPPRATVWVSCVCARRGCTSVRKPQSSLDSLPITVVARS